MIGQMKINALKIHLWFLSAWCAFCQKQIVSFHPFGLTWYQISFQVSENTSCPSLSVLQYSQQPPPLLLPPAISTVPSLDQISLVLHHFPSFTIYVIFFFFSKFEFFSHFFFTFSWDLIAFFPPLSFSQFEFFTRFFTFSNDLIFFSFLFLVCILLSFCFYLLSRSYCLLSSPFKSQFEFFSYFSTSSRAVITFFLSFSLSEFFFQFRFFCHLKSRLFIPLTKSPLFSIISPLSFYTLLFFLSPNFNSSLTFSFPFLLPIWILLSLFLPSLTLLILFSFPSPSLNFSRSFFPYFPLHFYYFFHLSFNILSVYPI